MQRESPSDTAMLIARGILLAAADTSLSALLAPGEEETIRRVLGKRVRGGWFGFALRRAWARRGLMLAERCVLGGIFTHYLARKRWIEGEVGKALEKGIRQLVVLGAGYDTLASRHAALFPDTEFFEIDHPATQAPKHAVLAGAPNLHFLPADLAVSSPAGILELCPAFRPDLASVVVAEGLTMYFPSDQVAALLGSAAVIAGPEGRVIFSYMEPGATGDLSFRGQSPLVKWWLRLRREPFLWGCGRKELGGFLHDCGLQAEAFAGEGELRSEILVPRNAGDLPLARGECLCLCRPLKP